MGCKISEVAYIGDDVNCLELLSKVGYPACPNDANIKVKHLPNVKIMNNTGGNGAVREFADMLMEANLFKQ